MASHDGDDCIVGGVDDNAPETVYIGGPCSLLDGDNKPKDGFRWMEISTIYAGLVPQGGEGEVFFGELDSAHFSSENDNYGETGIYLTQYMRDGEGKFNHAGLFLSSTSYLSKKEFEFSKTSFVIDKENETKIEVCVAPCLNDAGEVSECANSACPTDQNIKAEPGEYKWSVLAAAFDIAGKVEQSEYSTGKGWQGVKSTYGTGDAKTLQGELQVYQMMDFSNMNIDTLTAVNPDGTEASYADMVEDKPYTIGKMKLQAKATETEDSGFSLYVGFTSTYNVGTWKGDGSFTSTPTASKKVKISAVKPDDQTLTEIGKAGKNHILLFRYDFDVSGISATTTEGTFMVYDPTTSTKDKFAASGEKTQNTGGNTGGGKTNSATTGNTKTNKSGNQSTDVGGAMSPSLTSLLAVFVVMAYFF